jgi:hypothetical protein
LKITIKGIFQARKQLKKTLTLGPILERTLTAVTAERLRTEAYKRTPVDTGALRAAGTVSVFGGEIDYINPRPYAWYVEFGTGIRGSASWEDFYGRSRIERYWPQPNPEFSATWPGMVAKPYVRPSVVIVMDALFGELQTLVHEELK